MSLATLALSVVGVSHAQTPAVSLGVIQKYTPTIYLHPYDNHHPMAVEPFLSESSMLDRREAEPASLACSRDWPWMEVPTRDNHRMLVATAFVSSGSAVEE